MSGAETRYRRMVSIPPPPPFAPPSLPDEENVLTTYSRTRSVSPAPFIVSHDTFIKGVASKEETLTEVRDTEYQEKIKTDEKSFTSEKVKSSKLLSEIVPMPIKHAKSQQNVKSQREVSDSKLELHIGIESTKNYISESTLKVNQDISVNSKCQPNVTIEPPTPPVVKIQLTLNEKKKKTHLADEEEVSSDKYDLQINDCCGETETYESQKVMESTDTVQNITEEALKNTFPIQEVKQPDKKLKRRPNKKGYLCKPVDELVTTGEKVEMNIVSTGNESILTIKEETPKQFENLTNKEITVITEVLNSRLSRSRSSSRMERNIYVKFNENESVVSISDTNNLFSSEETDETTSKRRQENKVNEEFEISALSLMQDGEKEDLGLETCKDVNKILDTVINSKNSMHKNDDETNKQELINVPENMKDIEKISVKIQIDTKTVSVQQDHPKRLKLQEGKNINGLQSFNDPFVLVDNIADLTVEKLKEELLREESLNIELRNKLEFSADKMKLVNSVSEDKDMKNAPSKASEEKQGSTEVRHHSNNQNIDSPILQPSHKIEKEEGREQKVEKNKVGKKIQLGCVRTKDVQVERNLVHSNYPSLGTKESKNVNGCLNQTDVNTEKYSKEVSEHLPGKKLSEGSSQLSSWLALVFVMLLLYQVMKMVLEKVDRMQMEEKDGVNGNIYGYFDVRKWP
eukprot:GFUD01070280.1.p1 GENE.GFUD01070280.1~~GFUD01070280.1.p1  ORF type:complete len:688 (+),score=221.53 GFUD01070280.1:42-2105(+)